MLLLLFGLITALLVCLYKLITYRLTTINIKEQLELALHKDQNFDIKIYSNSKLQNDLIQQINLLNDLRRELSAKHQRYTQQNKEMISSITHDFRTPLTSMLGYVQILQDRSDDQICQKYLKTIENRTNALTKLIDDFYEISIIDSDEYPIVIEKLNPIKVLQEQLALYYEDLNLKFNKLSIDLIDNVIISNSDTTILSRIYSNLIKNALVHGEQYLTITSLVKDNYIVISFENELRANDVIDTTKLFERTYRSDQTRKINSTGLGLSIANELALLINSKLNVVVTNNTICFSLHIPIIQ